MTKLKKQGLILTLIVALLFAAAPIALGAEVGIWTTKAPMSTARFYFQTEVVDGKIYAIGGYNQDGYLSLVEVYDPATDTWTTKAPMSTPRRTFQTVVVDGKIYAIGGSFDENTLSSVEVYNPATDTWTTKASMPTPRYNSQAEVVDGKIYVMGGTGNGSKVEMYDPVTDTWTTKAPMSASRSVFQTEVIDGKIYAIGGTYSGSGTKSSVEVYSPSTNTWTARTSMSTIRTSFQTEVIDGKIYAIGGRGDDIQSSIEVYDPARNTWTQKASMSVPRNEFQTEVIDQKIYAIGGLSSSMATPSAEIYDPTTDMWTQTASMSVPRSGFMAETINGKIYAIGGRESNSSISSLSSVEEYSMSTLDPTVTVTPSADTVNVGAQFTTTIAIHNVTNICAEDIKVEFDSDLFEYIGASAQPGLQLFKEDGSAPGALRFIVASLGQDNAATGDKDLITLSFRAKRAGEGIVDVTKCRIADNATLEMDIDESNCGEAAITVEGVNDVNRSGEFTLLDLGIDAWYHGMDASETDSTKYDADVNADGIIDDNDLAAITELILSNGNYPFNN